MQIVERKNSTPNKGILGLTCCDLNCYAFLTKVETAIPVEAVTSKLQKGVRQRGAWGWGQNNAQLEQAVQFV